MLAVVIATYRRPDQKTPFYLRRALDSVYNQSLKDYQVYLIGDNYTDSAELMSIISDYPFIKWVNLERSVEREKYPFGDERLWSCGGVTAGAKGIQWALSDGLEYVAHLDHDNYWEPNHLSLIDTIIRARNPIFICTLSTYKDGLLPNRPITNEVFQWWPIPGGLISSSACVKYSATHLRARDCYAETGKTFPADADLWLRLNAEMRATGRKGYVITSLTCHQDEEGYAWPH